MDLNKDHKYKGDKSAMVDLDGRWQEKVAKSERMPTTFKMSKSAWKEYSKNMSPKMAQKAKQGLPIFFGAKVKLTSQF